MIARIIRVCSAHPLMTVFLVLVASAVTILGMRRLPLDALPDLSDTQVIVFAEWPGRSPDLIEDQVTYPLVTGLLSSPQVKYVRGLSMLGATQILVVFDDGTDLYWARSRIAEKLASVSGLPQGVIPTLGPEATGLGWVYQYAVVDRTGHLDLAQLRSLQDWHLRLALQSVRGVAEVASVGGFVKQYEVSLDPIKLQAFGLSPLQVSRAIRAGNQEIGANSEWRSGMTFDKIVAELNGKLTFPGMPNIWWMPIQTRIEMLSTGVRTPIGIKVLGANLGEIEKAGIAIEAALKGLPETKSVFAERIGSGFYIDIEIKRKAAALYGLNIADIQSLIETAVSGAPVSTAIEGRERYAITVRYAQDFRNNLDALARLVIPTPTGQEVTLGQVADLTVNSGAPMINSENGKLLGFVFVDVGKEVGLSEYVATAKKVIAKDVRLPTGVTLEWAGQFEALESAKQTLKLVIPAALILIIFILFLNTGSAAEVAIVLLAVPFSMIGAFWLLYFLGYKLSVATWVGILALAGLDAETGVVMLLYLTKSYGERMAAGVSNSAALLKEAIHEGAVKRIRPKLMTVAAALIGLLPVMWSTGTGAEVMKRIAAPMVGGIITSGLLELLVYPAIFALWKGREAKHEKK